MPFSIPLQAVLIAILIHALWGGNTVGAKFGFLAFGPMWSAFIRFALGSLVVIIFAKYRGVRLLPNTTEWPAIVIIGAMFTVQIGTMNIGIDYTTASMSSVLIATNPLFAGLFAHYLIPGDRINLVRAIGFILAFAGAALVILLGSQNAASTDIASNTNLLGNLICVGSAMLLGMRLVVSARALRQIHEMRLAVWQMLISLPIFAVAGFLTETVEWSAIDHRVVAGLAYQGIVVAGFGFATTFWLMKRYRPSVMMSFNFVSPIVGVALGAWLLGDVINLWLVAGVAIVAVGLVLISRK